MSAVPQASHGRNHMKKMKYDKSLQQDCIQGMLHAGLFVGASLLLSLIALNLL